MSGASPGATMRAAVIRAPGEAVIEDLPLPDPGPRQVRVRLEGCGVCASNVPVWEGREWFSYPLEPGLPGHEGWGVVDAVGGEVAEVSAGDRVAVLGQHSFSEFDMVEESQVAKLPAALGDMPFPGEPLACAVNVFERAGIRAGQTVAVVGVGFLGALIVQMAKARGARVFAVSRRQSALKLARRWGAEETLRSDDRWAVQARVGELTDGKNCDCVVEATGHQEPLDLAGELVGVRGRLVIAGYHQDGSRQIPMQSWNWRGIDVINAHEREEAIYMRGMRTAAGMVARGELEIEPLLTHSVPLSECASSLEMTRTRPEGFFKALVRMNG